MLTNSRIEQDIMCDENSIDKDNYETDNSDTALLPWPQNKLIETRIENMGVQQTLIITILQEMEKSNAEHHAEAATRTDIEDEGALGRSHMEEQMKIMSKTIDQLRDYVDSHSAKRQLTIYSTIMLTAACMLLLANMLSGPLTISSPIPELGVAVAAGFMLMARFAPDNKR
jgi:uncharacterized protein (DUF849 family)